MFGLMFTEMLTNPIMFQVSTM